MARPDWAPDDIDIEQPTAARAYDYLLGGDHNFAADREMVRKAMAVIPDLPIQAQANRAFLHRAVRFLVDSGVRQFLDIGSGIPTRGNVHEVARRAAPDARVVYVDIDPVAVSHGRQMLAGDELTLIVQEDIRHPEALIGHPEVRRLLDFGQPVGLLLVALLHVISDHDDPYGMVARMRDAMVPGSYLVVAHATHDSHPTEVDHLVKLSRDTPTSMTSRTHAEIERFFTGYELVDPGLVWAPLWRPESPDDVPEHPERANNYAGVGRRI